MHVQTEQLTSCTRSHTSNGVWQESCASMAEQLHSCSQCSKQFSSRSGLFQHLKKGHRMETEGGIKCLEENCKLSCRYTWQLRSHLMQKHAIQMKCELKEFGNAKGCGALIRGSVTSTLHKHCTVLCLICSFPLFKLCKKWWSCTALCPYACRL